MKVAQEQFYSSNPKYRTQRVKLFFVYIVHFEHDNLCNIYKHTKCVLAIILNLLIYSNQIKIGGIAMIHFFISDDIITFIDNKQKEIQESHLLVIRDNTKPAFIYAYSIFESTITEILRYYLNAFPEKIDKSIKIDKDELLKTSKTKDIISQLINHYIRNFSSDTLFNYLTFFFNTLSIENNTDKASVSEISTWRNKIVHDNAQAELMYKHIHNRNREQILSLSQLEYHIKQFTNMLGQIKEQIDFKYHKYTKEYLVRELWGYAFSSPLLSFDSIWEFDNNGALKIKDIDGVKKQIHNISSSEHLLLSIFCNNIIIL